MTADQRPPFRSFLRISRGAGYAQYGGLPVIVESSHHISKDEYHRRKSLPWPAGPGTFLPLPATSETPISSSPPASGPQWTQEVIGDDTPPLPAAGAEAIDQMFQQFKSKIPTEKSRKQRKRK